MRGGARRGYCATGSCGMASAPATTMASATIHAKTGRSMKKNGTQKIRSDCLETRRVNEAGHMQHVGQYAVAQCKTARAAFFDKAELAVRRDCRPVIGQIDQFGHQRTTDAAPVPCVVYTNAERRAQRQALGQAPRI